jgi:hypothetical protein
MMLLFVWVVIVLAVPKISMIAAGKIRDVPSVQEVQSEKDTAMTQLMAEGQEKIQKYFREESPDMSKPEVRAEAMAKVAEMQEEIFTGISRKKGQIDAEYDAKKAAQFRLAARMSRISPASVYTYASTELARTGFDRQDRFLAAARAYQRGFVQYFNEMMGKMIKQTDREEADSMEFDLGELPALNFQEAGLADSWNSAKFDLLILFLLLICFFMIGYVGFVRSDVR